MTTKAAEMIGSYCTRHGHTPDASNRFCLNCAEPLTAASATEFPAVTTEPTGIEATLAERGGRYGVFMGQAVIAQNIKYSMQQGRNWATLAPDMCETLDMIANKIARILNGDANYIDSWHDIIGYTKLIEDRLTREARDVPSEPKA
jgi:hypothetical protein